MSIICDELADNMDKRTVQVKNNTQLGHGGVPSFFRKLFSTTTVMEINTVAHRNECG